MGSTSTGNCVIPPPPRLRQQLSLPTVMFLCGFCILTFVACCAGLPQNIKIGGLFDNGDPYEETAFRHAVMRVNSDRTILPLYDMIAQLEILTKGDSYHASKQACQLLKDGVVGLIGPQSPQSASFVQSLAEVLGVPRIETKWDFRSSRGNFLINLYPHPEELSMAYAEVIKRWGWTSYIIIYENDESLIRLQDILQIAGTSTTETIVKQLPVESDDYRPLLKELRMQYGNITWIIVDCDAGKLPKIFADANEVGMANHYYKYFITSLDIHTLKQDDLYFGDINITAFRLVDPETPQVQNIISSWAQIRDIGFPEPVTPYRRPTNFYDEVHFPRNLRPTPAKSRVEIPILRNGMLRTETALIYDAVELFARALHALDTSQAQRFEIESLNCHEPKMWEHGFLLLRILKKLEFEGLSGHIKLEDGRRKHFTLDVMELEKQKLTKIAVWDSSVRNFTWFRTFAATKKQQEEDLKNASFTITTKISAPYFQYNETEKEYEGFSVDLIKALSGILGFKYNFTIVKDNSYGNKDNSTVYGWNGCVGEIMSGEADMAIGDMSITYDRQQAIDFTMPFMTLGISILALKPHKDPPGLFSFLQPFHSDVWIYMATAYLGVSLLLFILARVNPNEWLNPNPTIEKPDFVELTLHVINSMWFTIGSIMQQGADTIPKALSTRTVAGIWWFFTLIMISSYTANLAAFLTADGLEESIKDVKGLPGQSKVKYGSIQSGSTTDFFKNHKFPLYAEIWKNMQTMKPDPFVKGTGEGVQRVLDSKGSYVFFMESISIEYRTERICNLTQLGGLLDEKGYGIGFKKGSKYLDAFSAEIVKLSGEGKLQELKNKWWKQTGDKKCKAEVTSSGGATALSMGHVGGVFVVLIGGCVMACIMACVEFFWKARKLGQHEDQNLWEEISKELKFALQCQGDSKPVKKPMSLNPTERSETGSVPYLFMNEPKGDPDHL